MFLSQSWRQKLRKLSSKTDGSSASGSNLTKILIMLLMMTMMTTMVMIIVPYQVTTMVMITPTMNLGMKLYRPHSNGKVENKNSPRIMLPSNNHAVINFKRLSLTLAMNQGLKQMQKHLSAVRGLLTEVTGVLMMRMYLSP